MVKRGSVFIGVVTACDKVKVTGCDPYKVRGRGGNIVCEHSV
jgi:hypothetical protein